jgi:hypothetical protein
MSWGWLIGVLYTNVMMWSMHMIVFGPFIQTYSTEISHSKDAALIKTLIVKTTL